MTQIGVQGIKGSFSELAAIEFAKQQQLSDYKLQYLVSSDRVLAALENGSTEYAIFAIENSTGGVVIESILALAKYRCQVERFFSILIFQNLLVLPGTQLSDITSIHSHQQALRQCKDYLQHNFSNAPLVEAEDTALCAQMLAQGELDKTTAVIASESCANLYQLKIAVEKINDLKDNQTLFIAATQLKDNP